MIGLIICGDDSLGYELISEECDKLISGKDSEVSVVCTSDSISSLAEKYAQERGYTFKKYVPNWERFGNKAGYYAYEQMIRDSNICASFGKGGHRILLDKSRKAHLIVREYGFKEEHNKGSKASS